MPTKLLIVVICSAVISLMMYIFGWYCDKDFRQVMRKKKLSAFERIFLHFRGTKLTENRGHAIVCIKYERLSFISFALCSAVAFLAVKIMGDNLKSLIAGIVCVAMVLAMAVYSAFGNINKYYNRKNRIAKHDESGFEEFRSKDDSEEVVIPVRARKRASVVEQETKAQENFVPDKKIAGFSDGMKILQNKGLLDDDIFNPFGENVSRKYRKVRITEEFAQGEDIQKGKEALSDIIRKQLVEESYGINKRRNVPESEEKVEHRTEERHKNELKKQKDGMNPEKRF